MSQTNLQLLNHALYQLPNDVWDIIFALVPANTIGKLFRVSKYIQAKVVHAGHWRRRLLNLGLLQMFEEHSLRKHFTTSSTDWKEYYIAYHMAQRFPYDTSVKADPLGSEAPAFQLNDEDLIRQFPKHIAGPGAKIIYAHASRPYYVNWDARYREDGAEEGYFMRADGSFGWQISYRRDWHSTEYHDSSREEILAPDFNSFKAKVLRQDHKRGARFRFTLQRDYTFFLLTELYNGAIRETNLSGRHYSSLLALRKRPSIVVKWRERNLEHEFVVTSLDQAQLLAQINERFQPTEHGYPPIQGSHLRTPCKRWRKLPCVCDFLDFREYRLHIWKRPGQGRAKAPRKPRVKTNNGPVAEPAAVDKPSSDE